MIWFACKKCGKTLGKPESSAGAMVFCECGLGVRVPWESSAAPPPAPPPTPRVLAPMHFDAPTERQRPSSRTIERRSRNSPIDPNACFNHASADKAGVCADCGLSFCDRCLTSFQKERYCTACKNYRTRLLQRRPDGSKLAVMSFLLALAAGPAMLIMVAVASSRQAQSLALLALLLPMLSLVAGVLALRWIRKSQRRGGQQLAISGIALAVVVGLMSAMLFVFGGKLAA